MSNANISRLPIASAALAIRHVFIRNLEVLAHIGVYGHEQGKLQPVRINVDRSGFTLNPTSCDPFAVTSTLTGAGARFSDSADDSRAAAPAIVSISASPITMRRT